MFGIDAGVANAGTLGHSYLFRHWDRQDLNEQRNYDRGRFSRLVEDANRAGIHPLYAMGAGTTSPALQTSPVPRGAKSDIGQSIQAMGQNSLQAKQEELLDAQISQVKTDTELARQEVIAGQTARSVNKNPQTEMKIGGAEVNKNKDWSDAQIIEDRYGDVVSWAYGLGVVGADLYQAIKDKTKAPDSDINKIINEIKQYKLNLKFKNNSIGNSGKGKFYR